MSRSKISELSQGMGALSVAFALSIAALSGAGAAFAETSTQHKVTETFPDSNPCTGEPGTLTVTYNAVDHFSNDANGGGHGTFTQTGVFTFVPDSGGETFTGHFTIWGGFNENSGGTSVGTFTVSIHGTGGEGSILRANSVSHETSNPADIITSAFDKLNCH
jgi:hypothetical protein